MLQFAVFCLDWYCKSPYYSLKMSERLLAAIQKYKNANGRRWKEKLSVAADVSPRLIDLVRNGEPTELGYAIALACGCAPEDASQIELECAPQLANQTA